MENIAQFLDSLFQVTEHDFDSKALAAFRIQARENQVYREFLHYLDIDPATVHHPAEIPFLPIELFKTRQVLTGRAAGSYYFESSGTTGQQLSRHYVSDIALYDQSIEHAFRRFYGDASAYCLLALLPSYLERSHASLVYMCRKLIDLSHRADSGFYLNEWETLNNVIQYNEHNRIPTLLIGVTYALLELAERKSQPLMHTIIMETGGMKGRRKEITRKALHDILKNAFQTDHIHAEYGMTELLSQAYSKGEGIYYAPPWMRILVRDPEDPFTLLPNETNGCINVIDLANIHSCSFIATNDLGKLHADGGFEITGRFDNSDIRGCNLMIG